MFGVGRRGVQYLQLLLGGDEPSSEGSWRGGARTPTEGQERGRKGYIRWGRRRKNINRWLKE